MMPPEQDHNNISVQIEIPATNVSPCPDDPPQGSSVFREPRSPITLHFEDVRYSVNFRPGRGGCCASPPAKLTRTILNGVSGAVNPGELLAMLGPSGSGKTTLLTALAGRLPGKISGVIRYNAQPFSAAIGRRTGFVTQDDMLYPHLTVFETLAYAALLKLPGSLTSREKLDQAEVVVAELGLTRCRNSVVGRQTVRRGRVSGGERRRVSIGQEMLVDPSLLLVDEPTSGLDSTAAQRMVATLRRLASGGRTVVATVHQPSSRLFRMFDKLILLSDGSPIYCGGGAAVMDYFALVGFSPGFDFVNPADFLLDLANGLTPDSRQDEQIEFQGRSAEQHHDDQDSTKQFLIQSYRKNLHPLIKEEIQQLSQNHSHLNKQPLLKCQQNEWSNTWWLQFRVLLSRGLKERKHESYSRLRIFQVISVSLLSGLLWWHSDANHIQDQVGLLFFFSIFWGFYPLFNAIFVFPQERPMLARERASGMYRLSAYYIAKTIGDLPMELVLPTVFITTTYWMGGLKPSLMTFILTLMIILLNVLVAQGLGLALGAILMDVKAATTLSSVVMLVFLLASGYYIQHMPLFIEWLKYASFSHYCYKLLVGVQYSGNEVYDCGLGGSRCNRVADFPAVKYLGIDHLESDAVALVLMLVGYRLFAYVALRFEWHW